MSQPTGSQIAWLALGVPAILGWVAIGLGWLLAPRLTFEVIPVMWGLYAAGGWYALVLVIAGGSAGLLII